MKTVRISKLIKVPIKGGILTISSHEILFGEGWLGTRSMRRFPLHSLTQLEVLPEPEHGVLKRSMVLKFSWMDGTYTEIHRVGPIAAQRIRTLLVQICHLSR